MTGTIAAVRSAVARLAHLSLADVDPLKTLLPALHHSRALYRTTLLVLGGRGAGKTALFRFVNDPRTAERGRALFDTDMIPEATFFDAFSTSSAAHPDVGVLAAQASSASDLGLRALWMTHLLRRLRATAPDVISVSARLEEILSLPVADVGAWLSRAEADLGLVSAALDAADQALESAGRTLVAAYDNLDLVAPFVPGARRRYVSTLLALWLTLDDRYRRIRGKVFLRDDLFDAAELGFADASKLRSRSERLDWPPGDLFRVIARHLANGPSGEEVREWLSKTPGLQLRDRGEFGWMVEPLSESAQTAFAGKLAGRTIGRGVLKGASHEWMLARLWDARKATTPRAVLSLVGFAAEEAERRARSSEKGPLFGGGELLVALRKTSTDRVEEIKEETPAAVRLEGLRGVAVPLDRKEAIAQLSGRRPGEPANLPEDGAAIVDELTRVGVLRSLPDSRIDVPDIFRYAFEIGPDYVSAWRDFIQGDEPSAVEQLVREVPLLRTILRDAESRSDVFKEDLSQGDWAAARVKLEQALKLWEAAEDLEKQAETHQELALVNALSHNTHAAREHAQKAIALARKLRDPVREATAWLSLSWYGLTSEDGAEVDEALKRAAELIDRHQLRDLHASFYWTLAALHSLAGNTDQSAGFIRRCFEEVRKRQDDLALVRLFMSAVQLISIFDLGAEPLTLVCLAEEASVALGGAGGDLVTAFWTSLTDRVGHPLDPARLAPLRQRAAAAWAQDQGESLLVEILSTAASKRSSRQDTAAP